MANLHKMAAIGKRGVTLLLSDSTNALNEGMSMSESKVDNALSEIFKVQKGTYYYSYFCFKYLSLKTYS